MLLTAATMIIVIGILQNAYIQKRIVQNHRCSI